MSAPQLHVEPVALTPHTLLALASRWPERYPVLLDSAAQGALSHFSMLAALPRATLTMDAAGHLHGFGRDTSSDQGFLTTLEQLWNQAAKDAPVRPSHLPFAGGWIVYLGYELAREVEPALRPFWPAASLADARPVACAMRVPAALLQGEGGSFLVTEPGVTAAERARILDDVRQVGDPAVARQLAAADASAVPLELAEESPDAYLARVVRAQEYIRAGDIYQANLSRPWRARLPDNYSLAALYRRLRTTNPAPFAALAQFGDFTILSSSPERLLQIRGRRVDTRPIAGTHPRGATAADDRALAAALIAHPKERAEHVMLIDLARNDLGRVCVGGSVKVDEYMAVETYAHVHHIVSNVTGELRPEVTPIEALRAVFPGGTISGVPKVRCMQIIAELEAAPRGPYTGSLGYLNHDGWGDFNILIRTISVLGRQLELRAGAGIVADSRPERELEESRAKARGMVLALAPRMAS
ncbi:MAG: aminodeoxychorismate synthase component I [Pseudomonadota bacterium]